MNHILEPTPGSKDWTGFKDPYKAIPKSTYSWYIYKYGTDWAFNSWEYQKFDEQLTGGTELALDYWYQQLSKEFPNWQSEMWMTISTEPIENATCILYLLVSILKWTTLITTSNLNLGSFVGCVSLAPSWDWVVLKSCTSI